MVIGETLNSKSVGYVSRILFVLGLIVVGCWTVSDTHPEGVSPDASGTSFSSSNAMEDLSLIARAPHPMGSEEHARVRKYLIQRLRSLGLYVQVQEGLARAAGERSHVAGFVSNIIGRLPGTNPAASPVMLVAHYDTVATSPGAADDGASVAAIIEVLRATIALGPLPADVLVLFTDGEEQGLLGASYYAEHLDRSALPKVILNYEYRGNRGPMLLFEVHNGVENLIRPVREGLRGIPVSSAFTAGYGLMPNDTDVSVLKSLGVPVANFAAIEGYSAYHSMLDTPRSLSRHTLQLQGESMLRLVRALAEETTVNVRREGGRQTFFSVPIVGPVFYGVVIEWTLWGGMLVFVGALLWLNLRRRRITSSQLVAALLLNLVCFFCAVGLAWISGLLMTALIPGVGGMLDGEPYEANQFKVALSALSACAIFVAQWVMWKRLGIVALETATLVLVTLLGTTVLIFAPDASYLATLPALIGGILLVACEVVGHRANERSSCPLFARVVLAGVATVLVAPVAWHAGIAFPLSAWFFAIVPVAMLVLLLSPAVLVTGSVHFAWPALLATSLTALMTAILGSGFDTSRPRPDSLYVLVDRESSSSYAVSVDRVLDGWTSRFFDAQAGRRAESRLFGDGGERLWITRVQDEEGSGPDVTLVSDEGSGSDRRIRVRVASRARAERTKILIEGGHVRSMKFDTIPLGEGADLRWRGEIHGMALRPYILEFVTDGSGDLRLIVTDVQPGLPASPAYARPTNTMARSMSPSDTTQFATVLRILGRHMAGTQKTLL